MKLKTPLPSLRKTRDFKRVYGKGKCAAGPLFVVYALENDLEANQLGISASKKVGCAARRSRVKRLVREYCRLTEISIGYDLVIVVRAAAGEFFRKSGLREVGEALWKLFCKLGLTGQDKPEEGL